MLPFESTAILCNAENCPAYLPLRPKALIAEHLSDSRQGLNTQFGVADLLRQSVYSRLAGYEDLLDDFAIDVLDPTESRDLHEILLERYRTGSIIVTANREPDEWLA